MASKKRKRISKAWVATYNGPKQHEVVLQPLGEWCVTKSPDTGMFVCTHLPTGMAGFRGSLESAEKVLGIWARCPRFTLASWTKTLSKQYQRARDKALRS